MTLAEAKAIMSGPLTFGDERHIEARKVLAEEEDKQVLIKQLTGKTTECWCCEGSGQLDCKAWCTHDCPTCDGGVLTLTKSLLMKLDLGQLRELKEEQAEAA